MIDVDLVAPIVPCEGQLLLDLGEAFGTPRITIELEVVTCQICTGHHPTERCTARQVCPLCTGRHPASAHIGGAP